MKIDELYFGYTPYSKYMLLEEETKETSSNNKPAEESTEDTQKNKIKKNTKVNLSAYFSIKRDDSKGVNLPISFALELLNLVDGKTIVDSLGDLHQKELELKEQKYIEDIDKLKSDVSTLKDTIEKEKESNSKLLQALIGLEKASTEILNMGAEAEANAHKNNNSNTSSNSNTEKENNAVPPTNVEDAVEDTVRNIDLYKS